MRAELKAISTRHRTTTIYVTHDYVEALSLADRIAVLRAGRIVQVGTPEQIWARPADVFVARAFGRPRLSLLTGVVAVRDGEPWFVGGEGAVDIPLPGVDATADDPVQLGIRPRDATLHVGCGDVPSGRVRLDGVVYVLEHLGRQTEVTVQIGGSLVSVVVPRASAPALARDDKVGVLIDPSTTHVFLSGDEGRRISP
jgi:ABC-type sugar transport system ATPase subunit